VSVGLGRCHTIQWTLDAGCRVTVATGNVVTPGTICSACCRRVQRSRGACAGSSWPGGSRTTRPFLSGGSRTRRGC